MKDGLNIDVDGTKIWYLQGELHREDGPALEYVNGSKYWYLHGKQHRVDGPAEEYPNGTKYWYLNDKKIFCKSQEQFLKMMKMKAFW